MVVLSMTELATMILLPKLLTTWYSSVIMVVKVLVSLISQDSLESFQ